MVSFLLPALLSGLQTTEVHKRRFFCSCIVCFTLVGGECHKIEKGWLCPLLALSAITKPPSTIINHTLQFAPSPLWKNTSVVLGPSIDPNFVTITYSDSAALYLICVNWQNELKSGLYMAVTVLVSNNSQNSGAIIIAGWWRIACCY